MLTPIDIQNKTLKTGMGYNKKDVDDFLIQIIRSYEDLYKENVELKDKISTLSEGIQYYKTIETTLQKALVLAEKTSKETKEAAIMKAEALEKDARVKANLIIADAKHDLETIRKQTINLVQNYDNFRIQFKKLAETQLEMIEGESFKIYAPDLENLMSSVSSLETDEDLSAYLSDTNAGEDISSVEPAEAEIKKTEEELSQSIADLEASDSEDEFSNSTFTEQNSHESSSDNDLESFTTEEKLVINRQPSSSLPEEETLTNLQTNAPYTEPAPIPVPAQESTYTFTDSQPESVSPMSSQPVNTVSMELQPESNTGFTNSPPDNMSSINGPLVNTSSIGLQPENISPLDIQPGNTASIGIQPETTGAMNNQLNSTPSMGLQPESTVSMDSSSSSSSTMDMNSQTESHSTYIDELRFDTQSFSNPAPQPQPVSSGSASMPNPYISPSTQQEELKFDKDISNLQADLGQRIAQPDNHGDDDMFEFISTED